MQNVKENNYGSGAVVSFILGIIGLIAWIIPIIGAPITIVGLILGIKKRNSKNKGLAITGIILCIIGLLGTVINASIGAYKGANGTVNRSSNTTSSFNTISKSNLSGQVIFCEKIDNNLNPINSSTTFSAGQVYVKFVTPATFKTTKIKIAIYYENGTTESIVDSKDEQVNQDWNTFAIPIKLTNPGKYKIVLTRLSDSSNDINLGEGEVTIK
ncbi:DUF4190 domain-containing protein [Clostridium sp. YIM B02505]|uniref:DUF4190 domain-containing protein n=1 Tax=Clostridium yunnanense TaxID=2800325 RepID=A0ABS1EQ39_9CLOT|nr:DUF4190 domain-containing protein [Clostridium yunnanense]MBK1811531.1 DUF4190 domain-containing protein [Clostridium yunnanense]